MQFTSNILALVGQKDNKFIEHNKVTMWDTKASLATVSIEFNKKIIGVKMNSHILFAATK